MDVSGRWATSHEILTFDKVCAFCTGTPSAAPISLHVKARGGICEAAVDWLTIKCVCNVQRFQSGKPLPGATVGALGKDIPINQTHVRVQHHLGMLASCIVGHTA